MTAMPSKSLRLTVIMSAMFQRTERQKSSLKRNFHVPVIASSLSTVAATSQAAGLSPFYK
jgi:hypothetical protein